MDLFSVEEKELRHSSRDEVLEIVVPILAWDIVDRGAIAFKFEAFEYACTAGGPRTSYGVYILIAEVLALEGQFDRGAAIRGKVVDPFEQMSLIFDLANPGTKGAFAVKGQTYRVQESCLSRSIVSNH